MKKISTILVITIIVSALLLPGFAYGKGKPATTPGKGSLGAAGRPSAILSVAAENTGPAVGRIKGKGWKKFVLEGTVESIVDTDTFKGFKVTIVKIGGGSLRRIREALARPDLSKGQTVDIAVLSLETKKKGGTVYWSKDKKHNASFADLAKGQRVHVTGKINWSEKTLTATRVIIKPKPFKSED